MSSSPRLENNEQITMQVALKVSFLIRNIGYKTSALISYQLTYF